MALLCGEEESRLALLVHHAHFGPALQKHLDGGHAVVLRRHHQRRVPILVQHLGGMIARDPLLHHVLAVALGRQMQRRLSVLVDGVRVGLGVEEETDSREVAFARPVQQRRVTLAVELFFVALVELLHAAQLLRMLCEHRGIVFDGVLPQQPRGQPHHRLPVHGLVLHSNRHAVCVHLRQGHRVFGKRPDVREPLVRDAVRDVIVVLLLARLLQRFHFRLARVPDRLLQLHVHGFSSRSGRRSRRLGGNVCLRRVAQERVDEVKRVVRRLQQELLPHPLEVLNGERLEVDVHPQRPDNQDTMFRILVSGSTHHLEARVGGKQDLLLAGKQAQEVDVRTPVDLPNVDLVHHLVLQILLDVSDRHLLVGRGRHEPEFVADPGA
mmetsp:Transcript_27899/g.66281  ORF Transcript_27899/g.66281 Transcript_27899/m.66281 type:complete len:381 (-) Transcript_27899:3055-4197(-)